MDKIARPEMKLAFPSGTYEGILKSVISRPKQYQDNPPTPGIEFTYQALVKDLGLVDVTRHLSNTIGSKSHLPRDLKALIGEAAFTEGLRSDDAWNAMLESCVGRTCLLMCDKRTSANGNEYVAVTSVVPLPPGYNSSISAADVTTASAKPVNEKVFLYNISNIDKSHKESAIKMLETAGCVQTGEAGGWSCPVELPKLVKFQKLINDDIPF